MLKSRQLKSSDIVHGPCKDYSFHSLTPLHAVPMVACSDGEQLKRSTNDGKQVLVVVAGILTMAQSVERPQNGYKLYKVMETAA